MEKKLKIDPKKVKYDGHSFRLIIKDEVALLKKLKKKQAEIIKDLKRTGEMMEKKFAPRVYIFTYKDEQGNEFYEADLKPFAKDSEDQYLSLKEHQALIAPLIEALESVSYKNPECFCMDQAGIAKQALENYKKQTGKNND